MQNVFTFPVRRYIKLARVGVGCRSLHRSTLSCGFAVDSRQEYLAVCRCAHLHWAVELLDLLTGRLEDILHHRRTLSGLSGAKVEQLVERRRAGELQRQDFGPVILLACSKMKTIVFVYSINTLSVPMLYKKVAVYPNMKYSNNISTSTERAN